MISKNVLQGSSDAKNSQNNSNGSKIVRCKIAGRRTPAIPEAINCNGCANLQYQKNGNSLSELPEECQKALEQLLNEASERATKKIL